MAAKILTNLLKIMLRFMEAGMEQFMGSCTPHEFAERLDIMRIQNVTFWRSNKRCSSGLP